MTDHGDRRGDMEGETPPEAGFPPPRRVRLDIELARILRRDHGVVSGAALRDVGFTEHEIAGMVRHRVLIRLHRGVYADGRSVLSTFARLRGGLLAAGPRAFLAGRTAAGHRRLRPVDTRRIEIAVPGTTTPTHPGLVVHRARRPPERGEVTDYAGLRTASIPLILAQLAPHATREELRELLDAGVRRRAVDVRRLPGQLARYARWPGMETLRSALDGYLPRSYGRSGLEDAADQWLRADPRVPPYDRNVHIDRWEFDFWFGAQRAALEMDYTGYDATVDELERDRVKDAWCQINGVGLLRVTDFRFDHDRDGAMRDLLQILGVDPGSGDPARRPAGLPRSQIWVPPDADAA